MVDLQTLCPPPYRDDGWRHELRLCEDSTPIETIRANWALHGCTAKAPSTNASAKSFVIEKGDLGIKIIRGGGHTSRIIRRSQM
jgi:hypothetical protein